MQQGLGVERAAEERVCGEGAGHRRGRAAAEPAGEREALLDPQVEAEAGGSGLPEDLGGGQGGGVPRGIARDPGIRDREHPHPGASLRAADTRSPMPAIAMPRQSKPGPTFEVEPGA